MTFPSTTLLSSTTHLYSTPIAIPVSCSTPSNPTNRFHHSSTNSQPSLTLQSIQRPIQLPLTLPFHSVSTNLLLSSQPSFATATQPTLFSYYRYSYLMPTHPTNSISIPTLLSAPQFNLAIYPPILFHPINPLTNHTLLPLQPTINASSNHPSLPFCPHHTSTPINTNTTPLPTLTTSPFFTGFLEGSRPRPFTPIHTSTINHPVNHHSTPTHTLSYRHQPTLIAFPTPFSSIHAFYPSPITHISSQPCWTL